MAWQGGGGLGICKELQKFRQIWLIWRMVGASLVKELVCFLLRGLMCVLHTKQNSVAIVVSTTI